VAGVLLAGVVALGIVLAPLLSGKRAEETPRDTFTLESREGNFRLTLSKEDWKESPEAREGLRASVAVEKIGEAVWLAIATQDFGKRNARDAEIEHGAIERLESYFKEGDLEWEPRPVAHPLAGQPAQHLVFQGQHDKVLSRGECYLLRYRGIAYWVFLWAPSGKNKKWETTQQELAEVQGRENGGFILLDGRKGWEEQPPELVKYRGNKYPFTIFGLKGLWEEFTATDEDANGDLYLQRKNPEGRNNPVRGVNLLVSVLPNRGADPKTALKEARSTLLNRLPPGGDKPRADPAPGQKGDLGVTRKVGNVPGRVLELQVVNDQQEMYALLAVMIRPRQVFVIQCQCPWKDRAAWRGEFMQMLDTFNLRGK
jgi:hypothetical protein